MSQQETVRCNICGEEMPPARAKEHSLTPSHTALKRKLEEELAALIKQNYANDNSVIGKWEHSV